MDPILIEYESLDLVPSAFKDLYTEKDGKAVLTHVVGLKTQADVDTVRGALNKERTDHAATKASFKPFAGLKADEVLAKLSRFEELELSSKGKLDEKDIEKIVSSRLSQKVGPLETKMAELENTNKSLVDENGNLKGTLTEIKTKDIVRGAAVKMKVNATAIRDIELNAKADMTFDEAGRLITKDGVEGVAAGMDMEGYLKAMFKIRPHWWPESEGGGSKGNGGGNNFGGKNPWSADNWNLTEQGAYAKEHGEEAANKLAKSAGSYFGATRPTVKR